MSSTFEVRNVADAKAFLDRATSPADKHRRLEDIVSISVDLANHLIADFVVEQGYLPAINSGLRSAAAWGDEREFLVDIFLAGGATNINEALIAAVSYDGNEAIVDALVQAGATNIEEAVEIHQP